MPPYYIRIIACLLLLQLYAPVACSQASGEMVKISGGTYYPFLGNDTVPTRVDDFFLDMYPVTNWQYHAFVERETKWRKSQVKKVFADAYYLKDWEADLSFRPAIRNSPVTYVSWFAAKAYCACQGKRLPTADEWEYVSQASETKADASGDQRFIQYILTWYGKPNPEVCADVRKSFKNYYGVYGVHGLVWEWVLDFNATMLSGESRTGAGDDKQLFCAGGSQGAKDASNYVAFMRYAFRSSLKANYDVSNLGFRCAKSIKR